MLRDICLLTPARQSLKVEVRPTNTIGLRAKSADLLNARHPNQRSNMVRKMKSYITFVLGCSVLALASPATARPQAFNMAEWNFEVSGPLLTLADSMDSPLATAEAGVYAGTSIANGHHAGAATDWSSPVGNGSLESFSANTWAVGDYWQFSTSTLGYQDIAISWHQTRSSTGPATWDLYWSTDGSVFNLLLDNYSAPVITWSSATPDVTGTTVFPDVLAPAALDNQSTIYFRLTADSAASAAAGTGRIDNIIISGNAIPAPGALALLGLAGLTARRRRRC